MSRINKFLNKNELGWKIPAAESQIKIPVKKVK